MNSICLNSINNETERTNKNEIQNLPLTAKTTHQISKNNNKMFNINFSFFKNESEISDNIIENQSIFIISQSNKSSF